ncbi:DUF4197 domain-containing protein [Methylophilus luteus]|uniref:DUF4197 domain-containing protein n=1 Tax=Methylophilus luteus TaxID=640108 RepID=A0ABW3F960_9PROT
MKKTAWVMLIGLLFTDAQALDLKSLGDVVNKVSGNASADNSSAVSSLTDKETNDGLKLALNQGVTKAVDVLGATDGFLGNKDVKIPLPDSLKKVEKGMRLVGMGDQADELILKMNRAAEQAVPEAKTLLVNSIKQMSLADVKGILTGPQDAATQYFKKTTSADMATKFLPVVQKATANVKLADTYNQYAEMGSKFGLVKKENANINQYVTQKALDGVYLMVAKEEAAIRQDPMGQASNLLKKVFGAAK